MTETDVITQKCTRCRETKPQTLKFFSEEPRNRVGWRSVCKRCVTISVHSRWKPFNPLIDPIGKENFVLIRKSEQ